jgi:hypothetical protein
MNGERIGVELIAATAVWFLAVLAAFFFVGPVIGIIAILVGLGLLGWWLVSVIRSSDQPVADDGRARDVPPERWCQHR